jgi:natural product biosynthesis luciferase-like monooxygenase protein
MNITMTTAVFVGGGSLLIRCAEAYRHAGHTVQAVVSDNPQILRWAREQKIRALPMGDPATLELDGLGFDYLFSVANLRILPAALIASARQLAINFHDALLPRYAGLNAPAWALLAGESTHGVTWHEMTPEVDAGRIVRQSGFAMAADETALSLNTKCYEAGLASFKALLEDLNHGRLTLTPQQGSAEYMGAAARPPALGTLDFTGTAAGLARVVRALDFGPHPYLNPLARPKIFTGEQLLLVRTAQVIASPVQAYPGTVLGVQGDTVQVATADGVVVLGGCTDLAGQPHALRSGMLLPALSEEIKAALAGRILQVGRGEAFWFDAHARLAPLAWPYPQQLALAKPGSGVAEPWIFPLQVAAQGERSVAGLLSWLSMLTGQSRLSVFYGDDTLALQARGVEPWLSPWVPLSLDVAPAEAIALVVERTRLHIGQLHRAGPCTRDLPGRLAEPVAAQAQSISWGVCLSPDFSWDGLDSATLLLTVDNAGRQLVLAADSAVFAPVTATLMATHLAAYLRAFEAASDQVAIDEISLLPPAEAALLLGLNATATAYDDSHCVHEDIAARASQAPGQTAIECQTHALTYGAMEAQASALAARLRRRGVQPGDVVGLCLERSPDLVLSLLAIWKAGAAYLPLDPAYPAHRLQFMVEDSGTRLVLSMLALAHSLALPSQKTLLLDDAEPQDGPRHAPASQADAAPTLPAPPVPPAERAAYVIYTSGSTGQPKGVVVTHRNVMNFFAGMDQRVPHEAGARLLAVTSLSFDISVLELCWTLSRGLTLVLHAGAAPARNSGPGFSLFFFGNDRPEQPHERYQLLLEGARFADREGFEAVWTPERHFHTFGGLYPNAAMTSAALAAVTKRVHIRAGSCVLPLHHPIRAAEDWALVDNISQGRVGVSFAAGWQPNDFALAPGAFAKRKTGMFESIDKVQRLWRGERVEFPGPLGEAVGVQTRPSPIQREIPVWVTAAGNPETFEQAGTLGYRLLTHLLGQSLADVAGKIAIYRAAWRAAGHPGQGHVTLMLHTFIGDNEDAVRETVREPMKAYLASSVDLIRKAAWSFPAFVARSSGNGKTPLEIMESEVLSAQDMDALLEHSFARYYDTSALFGTPQRCLALVEKLQGIGVDEIGCLVDFGVAPQEVLAHLPLLKQVMDSAQAARAVSPRAQVADDITRHRVTHLQCTPSMASMLVADEAGRRALGRLSVLMVGGEALPLPLARQLCDLVPGQVLNMYGPTETTVWSTTCALKTDPQCKLDAFVPLGQPIANTWLSVRNAAGLECPALVPGELWIGGDGVTAGYLGRPELTAERFVAQAPRPAARWYRTGDLVRRHPDGALEFLGRTDHQVKIRGHRIELGEIESQLQSLPGVRQAVVVARTDQAGGHRLVGYVTALEGIVLEPQALQAALAADLPEIMVPASLMLLRDFPLTPNGKVDRAALPDPRAAVVLPSNTAPEGEFENIIAGLWREVLGLSEVGSTDNFFDLGGHSLLVVQVQRSLRDVCGREVSITDMFRFPTIRGLARHLAGEEVSTAVDDGLSRARARRQLRTQSRPSSAAV